MTVDLDAAASFMATHARPLDRRRFDLAVGRGEPGAVLAALDSYRNADGGYGWGLEPDLRDATSQPAGAMHAFEAMDECAPATTAHARVLCDWLAGVSLPDGGLPFALPVDRPAGCAPFWVGADRDVASLQITCAVASYAHAVGRHDRAVKRHPWLAAATAYCLDALVGAPPPGFALELLYAVRLLDGVAGTVPGAEDELTRIMATLPPDSRMHVAGGAEHEVIGALDLAPWPDTPARDLVPRAAIERDLDAVVAGQGDDGGWNADWVSHSPAAELEWRGYLTVRAVRLLLANGLVEATA